MEILALIHSKCFMAKEILILLRMVQQLVILTLITLTILNVFFEEEDVDFNDIEAGNTEIIPVLSDEEDKVITSFFEGVNLLCEQTGITDFQIVVFKKKDGEIIVEIDESYDVGH